MSVKATCRLILSFITIFALSGCISITNTPTITPTILPGNTPIAKNTSLPSQTQEPSSPSVNTTSIPEISKLNPGIYLLYTPIQGSETKIYAIHPGDINGKYLFAPSGHFDISSNGKFLAYGNSQSNTLDILDIESNHINNIPLPKNINCIDISVSADGKMVVCGGSEIYITSIDNPNWQQLTYWSKNQQDDTWDSPRFSPDNKWVAYFNLANLPQSEEDGLYLTRLVCLSIIKSCQNETDGSVFTATAGSPGIGTSFSWSPDSKSIVLPGFNTIYILDAYTYTFTEHSIQGYPRTISWSPAGDMIAFSDYDAYLTTSNGENQKLIMNDSWILGWIVIPWRFKSGDVYEITQQGANLNIRESPTIEGATKEKLQTGDFVTILDGPIRFDGYSWWKVNNQQNIEGWVVDIPDWYKPVK